MISFYFWNRLGSENLEEDPEMEGEADSDMTWDREMDGNTRQDRETTDDNGQDGETTDDKWQDGETADDKGQEGETTDDKGQDGETTDDMEQDGETTDDKGQDSYNSLILRRKFLKHGFWYFALLKYKYITCRQKNYHINFFLLSLFVYESNIWCSVQFPKFPI